MNFVDDVGLEVVAGRGGDGSVHFRREKYISKGGPDGGDGGDGGSVVVVASASYQTMAELAGLHKIKAEIGDPGHAQKKSGKSGEDALIHVPLGTVILDDTTGRVFADLTHDGDRAVVAKGGRGGWGNWRFRTSTNQAPDEANPGTPGQTRLIRLQLKLLADIGLIGLPNAGKSSLLNALTGTGARVAAYPFTTVNPNLGVLKGKGRDIVLADIPGLIEGAAGGKGLGHRFLKHVERTRLLIHCLAADNADWQQDYATVREELRQFSPKLMNKPEVVVLTKIDLLSLDERAELFATLKSFFTAQAPLLTSAMSGDGVPELALAIEQALK